MAELKCPHCLARLRLPETQLGLRLRCPACGKEFMGGAAKTKEEGKRKKEEDGKDVGARSASRLTRLFPSSFSLLPFRSGNYLALGAGLGVAVGLAVLVALLLWSRRAPLDRPQAFDNRLEAGGGRPEEGGTATTARREPGATRHEPQAPSAAPPILDIPPEEDEELAERGPVRTPGGDAGQAGPRPAATPVMAGEVRVWPEEKEARAAAIRQTLAALQRELQEVGGGSWENWAARLEAFRADVRVKARRGGWGKPGLEGFVFDGPSIGQILTDRLEARPEGQRPFEAVLALDRQLKSRGVDLVFMPIPDKLAVYPDKFSEATPRDGLVAIQMKRLLLDLAERDVEVIDLFTLFRDYRERTADKELLYKKCDTHWYNLGARVAAEEIARRLKRYRFVQAALARPNPFEAREALRAPGMDMAGAADREKALADPAQQERLLCIYDKEGRLYADAPDSPIILTADSFGRINCSMGAQTSAQVAYLISMPVSLLQATGSGPHIPVLLANAGPEYLANRRVLVWTGVGRQFSGNRWAVVELP